MNFKLFIGRYLLFSFVVALLSAIAIYFIAIPVLIPGLAGNFILFFLLSLASSIMLLRYIGKDAGRFQLMLLLAMFLKLVVAIVYFTLVYKFYSDNLLIFIVSFFLTYVLFTIFEVSFLVRLLRRNDESE